MFDFEHIWLILIFIKLIVQVCFNWSLIVMIIVLLNSWAIAWLRLVLNLSFLFPSFGVINWLWIQLYARFSTLYLTFVSFWAKLSIYHLCALIFVVEWILLGENSLELALVCIWNSHDVIGNIKVIRAFRFNFWPNKLPCLPLVSQVWALIPFSC